MAASTSHPLLTKSIHGSPRASIQMLGTSEEDNVSIQAIKQWCALHKSDKHSDTDCRAQQDTALSSAKKRTTVAKKEVSPAGFTSKQQVTTKNFFNLWKDWKEFPWKMAQMMKKLLNKV